MTAGTVDAGSEIVQAGHAIGSVASVAGLEPRLALAVLPLDRGDAPLLAGGVEAAVEPFVAGFAR